MFEEFAAGFAGPLGMQDYRVTDGYYHYELDKSIHPAYPFRLSCRDSARYGLLYLYDGKWGGERILSQDWVRRSTKSYSDTGNGGYAYMWWLYDQPESLGEAGMYSAQGVGGQMIAVLPGADLVIVNRTNTYLGKGVGRGPQNQLVALILEAKTGETPAEVELVALESSKPREGMKLTADQLATYAGDYAIDDVGETGEILIDDGRLLFRTTFFGTFALHSVEDDVFVLEDSKTQLRVEQPANGEQGTLIWELGLIRAFGGQNDAGNIQAAAEIAERAMELFPSSSMAHTLLAVAMAKGGDPGIARGLIEAALELDPENEEAVAMQAELDAR